MNRLRKIARWISENTSEKIVGDAVVILTASTVGGFAGVAAAIEWLAR